MANGVCELASFAMATLPKSALGVVTVTYGSEVESVPLTLVASPAPLFRRATVRSAVPPGAGYALEYPLYSSCGVWYTPTCAPCSIALVVWFCTNMGQPKQESVGDKEAREIRRCVESGRSESDCLT